jgi:uncharacterized protein YbcI
MRARSVGELEAAAATAVCRLAKEMHGCGPQIVRSHLCGELLVVMLDGVLSTAQRRLACCGEQARRDSLACLRRYRAEVWQVCDAELKAAVGEITGRSTLSRFHDFCPESGEEMLVFRLDGLPDIRPAGR